jgi:hypothetical protein
MITIAVVMNFLNSRLTPVASRLFKMGGADVSL